MQGISDIYFLMVLKITICFISVELAMIMDRLYGGVCYAGIDTDPELKYPKGAGRVAFSNQQSYIAAISARFVQLQHGEIDKRVGITDGNNRVGASLREQGWVGELFKNIKALLLDTGTQSYLSANVVF